MLRVSVVIPTHRGRGYVYEAVESVRQQTYPAHEIIVVVDGGEAGAADELAQRLCDVIVVRQPSSGVALARNSGIARATGDWVGFLDDDDLWHRDFLAEVAAHVREHPKCEAVRAPVWWFAESADAPQKATFRRDFVARSLEECHRAVEDGDPSENDPSYMHIHGASFDKMLERFRGCSSSTAVRRETLIRAGCFCPMQTSGEDWTMHVNVARLCEWHTLPRRLGFIRCHGENNTFDSSNGMYILAGCVNAWLSGRPQKSATSGSDAVRALGGYGFEYRKMVQGCLWRSIRRGKWSDARRFWHFAGLLLPRKRDYFYAMTPPQITWRWQRYVLGMHKGTK